MSAAEVLICHCPNVFGQTPCLLGRIHERGAARLNVELVKLVTSRQLGVIISGNEVSA